MAIPKQTLNINFSQGLETKTDPYQIPFGKFLDLQNTVFTKGNLLQKRNGFAQLPSLPNSSNTALTTFNGNLMALGTSVNSYNAGSMTWTNKGSIKSVQLETKPLFRSGANQSQCDSAVSSNGLVCVVFTDNPSNGTTTSAVYKYAVLNLETGQNIVAPTAIPVSSGAVSSPPKVFVLGAYFLIIFDNVITATHHLQYIAISIVSPTSVVANTNISSLFTPGASYAFDGFVANNNLFLAWNGSDGGGAIRITKISSTLVIASAVAFAGKTAEKVSVCADTTGNSPIVYVATYESGGPTGYVIAVDQSLNTVLGATSYTPGANVANVTSAAKSGVCTVAYEISNNYGYDGAVASNYINKKTITQAGTVSGATVLLRSVGLGSKAFIYNSTIYVTVVYSSSYQPTYFLTDISGNIAAKLAYSNAKGYLTLGLPSVTIIDTMAYISYLVKDLVEPVNKSQGVANTAGVYSQTGINLVSYNMGANPLISSEIGGDLHLSGGFLWMFDGYVPVEHGFHVWPDNVELINGWGNGAMIDQIYYYQATYEWTDNQGNIHRSAPSVPVTITTTTPANKSFVDTDVDTGADTITIASHGYQTGVRFTLTTDGSLPTPFVVSTNYYVIRINASTIKVASSYALALAGTPINITNAGSGNDTMHLNTQSNVTVYVPYLRLTYKTANPVNIVIYRWSTAQQIYYQVTSVSIPQVNDTTNDYLTYVDTLSDSQIAGNSILYTTGGVIENIAAPAAKTMTLFDDRLFLISAEDGNIWFSKQVIPTTPVEMSDQFTLYIAPTIGSSGSTGLPKCLFPMDDKLIVFKEDAIYYINGSGPDNTGVSNQYSQPIFITSTIGCSDQNSIVFTPQGLMFQSDKGIWLLGRDLSTNYVGAPVEKYNSAAVVGALAIPETNQVRFTLDSGITLMYDYFYGQWGTFVGIPGVASVVYQKLHTFINSSGQVFQENPGVYLDGANPVLLAFKTGWFTVAGLINFQTGQHHGSGLQGFERAYFFYLLATYFSPHTLTVSVGYDYNPYPSQTTVITPDNANTVYGNDPIYGDGDPYGGIAALEQWRVFLDRQKCQSFQIWIQEFFDASVGADAGAGFTMSGIDLVVGAKGDYPRLSTSRTVG